jgi:RecA/RadA recombinase
MTISVDNILSKLDPKTRARVQSAQDVKVFKQKTPSIGLNMALKGGLGYGRQVLVWGNKSAGKSSFCLQMIALAQKRRQDMCMD